MVNKKWEYLLLSEACEINPGKKELNGVDEKTEVSFLPMASVSENGYIINFEIRKLKEVIKGFTYFREGDVLLAKITPCFENGKRAIARNLNNGIGFGSTEFHVLRPKEKVTPDWIFYAISKDDFRNIAKSQMTGTAGQKRVPKRVLAEYKIPVPKKKEQEQISESIETQFTRLDAAVQSLRTIKQKLDVYRKSVLKAAFEGKFVDKFAFETKKLGDFERKGGGTPSTKKKEYWGGKINWITSANIDEKGNINFEKKITELGLKNSATNLVPKGSVIVVTRVGLGKVAVNEEDTAFSQDSQGIICKKINPYYLMWHIKSAANQIISKGQGTTISGITVNKLNSIGVKMPSLDTQDEIVNQIESRFSVIDKLEEVVDNALKKAERLRKSILKAAFEGRLVN